MIQIDVAERTAQLLVQILNEGETSSVNVNLLTGEEQNRRGEYAGTVASVGAFLVVHFLVELVTVNGKGLLILQALFEQFKADHAALTHILFFLADLILNIVTACLTAVYKHISTEAYYNTDKSDKSEALADTQANKTDQGNYQRDDTHR